jgi:hypothetical protein
MTRTEAGEGDYRPRCTGENWHTERSLLGYHCREVGVGGLADSCPRWRFRGGGGVGVFPSFFFLFVLPTDKL